ncbi:MAG: hypothetical protein HY366_01045 [Candidatus Aenigmarchaeota archaeon]|nr:hypothetical protein [Candidatus Aenigmarchaeota archaeon]
MQRDRSDDLKTRLSSSFVGESVRVLEHALLGDERLDQQGGNMAVLITEPAHDRFRQMGRRRYHDWQEYGVVGTDFSDGGHARLPDGLCGTPRVMEQFYAFDNHTGQLFDIIGAGPRHMQIRYFQTGGELGVLKLDYKVLFHQELPTFEASR